MEKEILCQFCKKEITQKENFVMGSHYFSNVTPYHKDCFDKAKKEESFFKRPVMKVLPQRINFFIVTNVINIILGFGLILLAIISYIALDNITGDLESAVSYVKFILPAALGSMGFFVLVIGTVFTKTFMKFKRAFSE